MPSSERARVAVAYLRVSTEDQTLGPEAQRATIEAWSAREGVAVASWHLDAGVSGATPLEERPALCAALADLRARRAAVLVVAKRDRIARDVVVAAMTERAAAKAGARVVSADGTGNGDTPADAFMRTILDGAAAYERALIRARTKSALAVKRARGEKLGGIAPYGFRAESGKLVPVEDEQRVLSTIRDLRARGLTLRDVVSELEQRGVRSRAGKPFALTQVHRMLVRAA